MVKLAFGGKEGWEAWEYVDLTLKNDTEFLLQMVALDERIVTFLTKEQLNDRQLIILILQKNGKSLKYLGRYKGEYEMALAAINSNC